MSDITLNFVPLKIQDRSLEIYRKIVDDSSQFKAENDFRVNLPFQQGSDDWVLFDVSKSEKEGYDSYNYRFIENAVLTVHLIYSEFIELMNKKPRNEFYIPNYSIHLKEFRYVIERYDDGKAEIVIKPYYLKIKKSFGFLLDYKYSLDGGASFDKQTQMRSLSLDKSGKSNIYFYKDKKEKIESFSTKILSPILISSPLEIETKFECLQEKKLDVKTYMVGSSSQAKSQFLGIRSHGPYRRMDEKVRYLFLFSERTRSLAREIYLGLVGKLYPGQFSGLQDMFSLPIHKDIVEHKVIETFDSDALVDVETKIKEIRRLYPDMKIMLIAVIPKGFKGIENTFNVYGHLKLIALRNESYCQFVTEDTFFKKDQLKWAVSNIALQIFCKLGGAPWLVKPAKNNCLIFGIGSVQQKVEDSTIRYTAYTICLDSSGDFKYIKPLSNSPNEITYLERLKLNLSQVLLSELCDKYKSFVLHLPYKISRKEINVIKEVVGHVKGTNEFEVIVVRINTKHKFLGFSDHNTCIPYESSYVQLSNSEFLIWSEGLKYGNKILHKRVSEPLYVDFIMCQEDWVTKKECLQDILNLSGANWRGFNSKAQPISILYSRLIAKFMKEFSNSENVETINMVSAESKAPWFL